MPTNIPQTIGPYRILRQLGEGGMGTVYLAEDTAGNQVALKVPSPSFLLEPTYVRRLYREALAAAQIDHPNIARILDVQQEAQKFYLVMTYIEGQTLAEALDAGRRFTAEESLALVRSLARTVQIAHNAGIIHRDLKPANIMLRENGDPIVMDFGMARRFDNAETLLTPAGAIVGTPGYMAPEQITAASDQIGPGCDIYALGVLLYELLTGTQPFSGSMVTLLGSIVADPPTPPRTHDPQIEPALETLCLKALEKNPTQRYLSADDFAEAIAAYERGERPQTVTESSASTPPAQKTGLGSLFRWGRKP